MSYRRKSSRNWGVLIATILAVPIGLVWTIVAVVGGGLVCANPAADCAGVVWPLLLGIVIIAGGAAALGYLVNSVIRVVQRDR